MELIIKDGRIIDPLNGRDEIGNLYIKDGLIVNGQELSTAGEAEVIQADGKVVMPGLIDLHVHFRDPGFSEKEDILTGSQAAVRGGYTTVCCMPNTNPAIDNVQTLTQVDEKGRNTGLLNVLATSAMTIGQKGESRTDLSAMDKADTRCKELIGHGIAGVTEDGKTLIDFDLMFETMKEAKELGLLVMDHAEEETAIVARDIELVRMLDCPIHIQHVSKAESVDLIRHAKAEGISITAETAPHYFTLTRRAEKKHGSNAKMNPPLQEESDRRAVIKGLKDGTIDIIATDHAPHTEKEKDVPFRNAPFGIIGLETAFAVSYEMLVCSGALSLAELVTKMSVVPAKLIGLKRGELALGCVADITIVDLEKTFEIDKASFASKGRNTPFQGMRVRGDVCYTLVNGDVIWRKYDK